MMQCHSRKALSGDLPVKQDVRVLRLVVCRVDSGVLYDLVVTDEPVVALCSFALLHRVVVPGIQGSNVVDQADKFVFWFGFFDVSMKRSFWDFQYLIVYDICSNFDVTVVALMKPVDMEHEDLGQVVKTHFSAAFLLLLAGLTLNPIDDLLPEVRLDKLPEIIDLILFGEVQTQVHESFKGVFTVPLGTPQLDMRLPAKQINNIAVVVLLHLLAELDPVVPHRELLVDVEVELLLVVAVLLVLLVQEFEQPSQEFLSVLLVVALDKRHLLLGLFLEVLVVGDGGVRLQGHVGFGKGFAVGGDRKLQHFEQQLQDGVYVAGVPEVHESLRLVRVRGT